MFFNPIDVNYLSLNESLVLLFSDLCRLEEVADVLGLPVHLLPLLGLNRLVFLDFVVNLE